MGKVVEKVGRRGLNPYICADFVHLGGKPIDESCRKTDPNYPPNLGELGVADVGKIASATTSHND